MYPISHLRIVRGTR